MTVRTVRERETVPDEPIVKIVPAPLAPGVIRADALPEPEPIVLMGNGIVASYGMTLLFGKTSAGKGSTCVEVARALIEEGHTVLIADFERNYPEYYRRINGLVPDEYKSRLYMIDDEHTIGSIIDMEEYLLDAIRDYGATVLIVDSYGWAKPAVSKRTAEPDAVPIAFSNAVKRLHVPTIVTTHVAKVIKGKPEPYGSVYLSNASRATWYLEKQPTVLPSQHRTLLRWGKGNNFGEQPEITLTFTYKDDTPVSCEWVGRMKTLLDKIYVILLRNDSTHSQVYEALKAQYPRDPSIKPESIRQTLLIYSREGVRQKFIRLPKRNNQDSQVFRAKK